MTASQICILVAIIVYLVGMIVIGFVFSRKGSGNGSKEFYLGGRKLGPLVTAMSAEASDMSSYLLMGLPGLALFAGLAEVSWTAIGLAIGTYLNFLFVAKRLRRYSSEINAITIPDFFSSRYKDDKKILSLLAAVVIIVFFVPYTASGFEAVGTLFNSLFGWNYHLSMIIGAAVIIGYTVLGGFLAVSTTDLIQSIFMTFALIVIIVFGVKTAGGVNAVVDNVKELPGFLNLFQGYDKASNSAGSFGFFSVVTTLAWGLGYFGMPHILLRFMAIRDEKEVKTSRRIASVWVVLSMAIAIIIGVIGVSIVKAQGVSMDTSSDAETIIIFMSRMLSENGVFFAIVAGIILAGILAATMSTADSQLLAASSSVSYDLIGGFFKVKMSEKVQMLIARGTVIAIAIVGVILVWNPNSSVFRIVSFAWAGFGAAFGPLMLFSLFWKRTTKAGAIAGMVSGAAMVFIWKFLISKLGGVFTIYELLPAFIISSIVIVVVSLLTKKPDDDVIETFEKVKLAK